MKPELVIRGVANPRVKDAVRLRRRTHRDRTGQMLIEGYRENRRALQNGYLPETLFYCRELFLGANEDSILEAAHRSGATLMACSKAVFSKMSYRDRPDGLLAVGPRLSRSLAELNLSDQALVVVAEAIEKPGNLGTILRSADAAGVEAVIVCDRCTDMTNPNVVRASVGALFTVSTVEAAGPETFEFLRNLDFKIYAASPDSEALYSDSDLTGRVALVVGSEQYGLSEDWMKNECRKIRIPMLGQCDSLNVASAATILIFESVRQRTRAERALPADLPAMQ